MTENRAVEMLRQGDKYADEVDFTYEEYCEALNMAIQALEEIQQYRAIGTVEECRTAVERMKPRKIKGRSLTHEGYVGNCPCCGKLVALHDDNKICRKCGQAFDWSE